MVTDSEDPEEQPGKASMHSCAPLVVREGRLALEALVAKLAGEGNQLRGLLPAAAALLIRLLRLPPTISFGG